MAIGNRGGSFPLHIFIISWAGQHENAIHISKELMGSVEKLSIVYSDPDPDFIMDAQCRLIRRPNNLFWEDKFKVCLDECQGGPFLIIHADCRYERWPLVLERCAEANVLYSNIGVWAPKIDKNYFDFNAVKLLRIKGTSLSVVALTNGIVFYLSPAIIKRMQKVEFGSNPLGWGIDLLMCSAAHVKNKLVLIDESIEINHSESRGYDSKKAELGMVKFYNQFSNRELIQCRLLRAFVDLNHIKNRSRLIKKLDAT